jgi:3-oxoacyl-[acyl-carrier-protein] synthase-3
MPRNPLQLTLKSELSVNKRGSEADLDISEDQLQMNGAAVFQFAIESVPRLVNEILSKIQVSSADVDWYLHQGSRFVVDQLSKSMGLDSDSYFRSAAYGNTVSGSIPFQLEVRAAEREHVGLVGFGMGLSAKVAVYKVEKN